MLSQLFAQAPQVQRSRLPPRELQKKANNLLLLQRVNDIEMIKKLEIKINKVPQYDLEHYFNANQFASSGFFLGFINEIHILRINQTSQLVELLCNDRSRD